MCFLLSRGRKKVYLLSPNVRWSEWREEGGFKHPPICSLNGRKAGEEDEACVFLSLTFSVLPVNGGGI